MAQFFHSWVKATLPNDFEPSASTPPPKPSAPTLTPPSQTPSSQLSSSRLTPAATQAFTPIPPLLENRLDTTIRLLERISFQLAELQASQQDGFHELYFRHDTQEVNQRVVNKNMETSFLQHTRGLIDEVSKCFAHGGPLTRMTEAQNALNRRLYKEVRNADDAATNASKGERQMRSLNIQLLGKINDLRC